MIKVVQWYIRTSLMARILGGFVLGTAAGIALWAAGGDVAATVAPWVSPFGAVFVNMLKMIVIPVVFATLIVGAASLPLKRFGRIGARVVLWYLATSLLAAIIGVVLALALDPGAGVDLAGWEKLAGTLGDRPDELAASGAAGAGLVDIFLGMFANPFEALARGDFLPMIVFAILFGLGVRVCLEALEGEAAARFERLVELVEAVRDVLFRIVDWILEYAPIGVLALTTVNFGLYGPSIFGPYVKVVVGVIAAIAIVVLVGYAGLIAAVTRVNPYPVLGRMREAMLTAFVTRSSAATLPVSLQVAERDLGVREEVAAFSLPLGATINMDGVCVHLPMFAVLAANLFGFELGIGSLFFLVVTTVLAAIGAGGVPGGSLMLLFLILDGLGLSADQVAVVVALALGVNPILDMFETANNVTGDLVCTWVVATTEGLVTEPAGEA